MEQTQQPVVVGVRFSKIGKVYHFTANDVGDIKIGDMVVVETSRGWQLGQVAQLVENPGQPSEGWKSIDRRATPRDLLLRQMWQMKEAEVIAAARTRTTDLRLQGIKIVSAEYSFDGSRLTILFSSETEEKYELKSLRGDMQKMFGPSQVEMRQIGPRDVAKTHCGMGACGLETRCCCSFLTEFSSISIRMAKEQGISLTPTEITGMCGRLRCCLIYEYDTYVEARQKLPKRNKRVRTPQGDGKVVDVSPLSGSVRVDLGEAGVVEFQGDQVSLADDSAPGQPVKPYAGTQQPSEIDQAIVGDAKPEPFVIAPDEGVEPSQPPEDRSWNITQGTQQPDRPQREGQDRRGPREPRPDQRQDRPGGRRPGPRDQRTRGSQQGGQAAPGEPREDRPQQGPRQEGRGQQPQDRQPREGGAQGDRPQGDRPQGDRGPRPGDGRGRPGDRPGQGGPGGRRPQGKPRTDAPGSQQGGQPQDRPPQQGDSTQNRGPRDRNQRRRGRQQRDSNDGENRA